MTQSKNPMNSNFNLPNVLTSIRLALSPVLAVFLLWDEPLAARYAALIIVIFSELTDLFDGHMARIRGQVTDFGKILDPMADSIYRDTVFLCLAVNGQISLFLVLPIFYRDSIIATLRTVCAYRGIVLAARWSGKMKAISQATVIILILLLRIYEIYHPEYKTFIFWTANILMGVACAFTLYSAYDYLSGLVPRILSADEKETQN